MRHARGEQQPYWLLPCVVYSSHLVAHMRKPIETRRVAHLFTNKKRKKKLLNNACVEKRFMTRKVTAYCLCKRLLLLPYTNKLFSTRPHNTSTHISTEQVSTIINNETRYFIP